MKKKKGENFNERLMNEIIEVVVDVIWLLAFATITYKVMHVCTTCDKGAHTFCACGPRQPIKTQKCCDILITGNFKFDFKV